MLDDDGHAHIGILLFENDDVFVEQPDAPFTVAPWHALTIARAAMNANATVPRSGKSQKPVTI